MEDRFPSLHAYLGRLPAGLESYPECQSKGSLLRSALAGHEAELRDARLPEPLQAYLLEPPPAGVWLPAAHLIALTHAICDRYYPTEEDVMNWGRRRTEAMASHPMYRALIRVSGPRVFFSMTAKLNRLFQRGTYFSIASLTTRRVVAKLTFPPRLHSRQSLLGTVALCEAIVGLTGGSLTQASMSELSETHATFECDWTR